MNKKKTLLFSVLLVLLPLTLFCLYETEYRQQLGYPSLIDIATQPLAMLNPSNKKKPAKKHVAKLQPVTIASSAPQTPTLAKKVVPPEEPAPNKNKASGIQQVSSTNIKAPTPAVKTPKQVRQPTQSKTDTLHIGKNQDGQLLPNLSLDIQEENIQYLLKNKMAFLIADINGQQYLLSISNPKEPYKNVIVKQLREEPDLSDRYMSLSRNSLDSNGLYSLDNTVALKTGFSESPEYKLIFSREYNQYLVGIQHTKIDEHQLNLEELSSHHVPVSMQGKLYLDGTKMKLMVTALVVGQKQLL